MGNRYYSIVSISIVLIFIFSFIAGIRDAGAKEWHVAISGNDNASGSLSAPLRHIQAAAEKARPGDVVTVHAGVYRERVAPVRGGISKEHPLVFRAARGERVEIKGSEVIKGWKQLQEGVWKVALPNCFFGDFNPYTDTIHGDWLARGSWCHSGEVYLNDTALTETPDFAEVSRNEGNRLLWYCKADRDTTRIWANFSSADPNHELVEINVRRTVFYPEMPFINYITVRGFHISQAATPWAPPTAEQIGAIGTHWSKGWVIEDNMVSHSKCVGITLGKYSDEWDNRSESEKGYVETVRRALKNHWDKEHIGSHLVRNNRISRCGQAGIAGSLGAIFSVVSDNIIHDIGCQDLFWGYELAGIKFHAAVDVLIRHNHIYRTEGGIWLDWMTQGTRITENLLHDNRVQDFSLEVNHGPILVDNNLFLSPELAQIKLSQGIAFVHNLIAWKIWPTGMVDNRRTPYLQPHGTQIAGFHDCPCGDVTYLNNLFTGEDFSAYGGCVLPLRTEGNRTDSLFRYKVEEKADGWYLQITLSDGMLHERTCRIAHTGLLPDAVIPGQAFSREDLFFTRDYTGRKRSKRGAYAGAIEWGGGQEQRIKIFSN